MITKLIGNKVVPLKGVHLDNIDMDVYVAASTLTEHEFDGDLLNVVPIEEGASKYAEHDSTLIMDLFGGDTQC